MADTITGPGLGGGPSEIAAVSVGVYVVNNTGPGFAAIQAEAAVAGNKLAAEGAKAGSKYGESFIGASVEKGHGIYKMQRGFHHAIAGFLFGPLIIEEAFHLGEKIGEKIADGLDGGRGKRIDEEVKTLGDRYEEAVQRKAKAMEALSANDADAVHKLPTDIVKRNKEAIEAEQELGKVTLELANAKEKLKRASDALDQSMHTTAGPTLYQRNAFETLQTLVEILTEKYERLSKTVKQAHDFINQFLRGESDAARKSLDDKLVEQSEQRRLRAQSPVFAERMAADMSRIRQLMELGTRQRFPSSAGGSVIRGGGVR